MDEGVKELLPADYPARLREIPQAPKRLYVRGELPDYEKRWLAVVGSRACTPYGEQATRHLIEGLRGYPVVIVSGLAFGIDTIAHKAALDAQLPTVAIPGSGLDWNVLYPRGNVALAREILDTGGALISEFAMDMKATDYTFPQRNRIMAGISRATLIVEAKEKSGSLITARLAADYNRDVLVVPGSIFSAESAGVHQFLKLGGVPITSVEDLLQALELAPREKREVLRTDLSEDELRVLDLIGNPISRDALLSALELPITEANILLSMMEIKGLIVEELGVVRAQ
jgi:DNA processing protein